MRPIQLLIILLFGGFAIQEEFNNIKESSIIDILGENPILILLCGIAIIYLIINTQQFICNKRVLSFIPSVLALAFIGLIFWHKQKRKSDDNSPSLFEAWTQDIGNDGGFRLEFKKNNILKGLKIDHLSSTTYWGTYQQSRDTLILNIPLDFKMGRQATLENNTFRIIDDSIKFEVSRQ
jgi:hypothetical protein